MNFWGTAIACLCLSLLYFQFVWKGLCLSLPLPLFFVFYGYVRKTFVCSYNCLCLSLLCFWICRGWFCLSSSLPEFVFVFSEQELLFVFVSVFLCLCKYVRRSLCLSSCFCSLECNREQFWIEMQNSAYFDWGRFWWGLNSIWKYHLFLASTINIHIGLNWTKDEREISS